MSSGGGKGKRGGRGKGGGEKGGDKEPRTPTKEDSVPSPSSGAGRGIPDFKENPTTAQNGKPAKTPENRSNGNAAGKFNAKEALQWMTQRNSVIMEQYEQQKATGVKSGDIVNFQDIHSTGNAWGSSRPVIPAKEDFLFQLQQALRSKA
eukprot:TRINITY_DN102034_c0_g1_i1.p1 TRINITY_DN102034_c0_g1~~TRINITY_DN102034_c0_g1_i1.p1  ORF type:complete len:149 (-),score=42.04 TRINITY_DN102034_c0_g1_i1:95-541(-)